MNFFTRQAAAFQNDTKRRIGALVGIVQGVLADGQLHDGEVEFLQRWLLENENAATSWPGNVLAARIRSALADGHISPDERTQLMQTLQALVGGTLEDLASSTHVSQLALDEVPGIHFPARTFCFTGDFAFGPRGRCAAETERVGGLVLGSVSKKLHYLVVGGLGSPEWKHGSFGTKIEKAMQHKATGTQILVIHEDLWAASLFGPG